MSCVGSNTITEHDDVKIAIAVAPNFERELSHAGGNRYTFSYHIEITNHGERTVQLVSREWLIICANNSKRYVRGEGVVGERPHIEPQMVFCYGSFVHLPTPVGFMQGHYLMRRDDNEEFKAMIDIFTLSVPDIRH